jgi:osmoprotectant transport system permease protein
MTELLRGITGLAGWFTDPVHWQGPAGIPAQVGEHLLLSGLAFLIAAAIGLPTGIAVGHSGRGATLAVNLANLGRALPTLAVMGIVLPITAAIDNQLGFKVYPALIALAVLGIPPILVNAYAGIAGVDRDTVEAGRGMGMRARDMIARVEIPIALPVIVAGIRSASAQILATATLAAIFGGPGLGRFLVEGYAQLDYPMMFAGVILVGVLYVASELLFGALQARLAGPARRPPLEPERPRLETTIGA